MDLKDKIVVVTGSSSGIGMASAIKFAEKGAKVVVTYRVEKTEGEKVVKECSKHNESILLQLDITDSESIRHLRSEVLKRFGKIDVLLNNAGIIIWKKFIEQTEADISGQIDINLKGTIMVTRAFMPDLIRQKKGLILNIASGAAKEPTIDLTVYCGSKFGVRGFTQALALELPEGVRTYCINPGMTATRMTGYQGTPPEDVADVIVAAAEEKLDKKSGEDVDVWEYIE